MTAWQINLIRAAVQGDYGQILGRLRGVREGKGGDDEEMTSSILESSDILHQVSRLLSQIDRALEQERKFNALHENFNTKLNDLVETRTAELHAAYKQLEAASAAKSQFLASMSHEFRTPLNAIIGFSQFLEMQCPNLNNTYAHDIHQSGQALLAIIDQILVLTEMDRDTVHVNVDTIDLDEILPAAIGAIQGLADRMGVTVECADCDTLPPVMADRQHLTKIVDILLSNAVKYNLAGGRVKVSVSPLPNGRLRLTVEDTGMGFTETRPGQALEPFERLGQFASTVGGAGVGLTIANNFAKSMNAELSYASIPGQGSVFHLDLPVAVKRVAA
ncbi:MAG: HAMP domain-containing histidine kinase [Alphaproteobacteria bacterium]|nr:HAMP domain-containing histidine kinase [Alphaproteobacteria bacterium]